MSQHHRGAQAYVSTFNAVAMASFVVAKLFGLMAVVVAFMGFVVAAWTLLALGAGALAYSVYVCVTVIRFSAAHNDELNEENTWTIGSRSS